jgi:uncharacterized membrane protein HdeD (DUF308 family)
MHYSLRDIVRGNANLFIVQGTIMTILGVAAIVWPAVSSLAVNYYVGWLFLLSGIVGFGMMFFAPTAGRFIWSLLTSALTLFAGVVLISRPAAGTISLTLVLTALFLAEGLFQIIGAFTAKDDFPESWGWMLFSGIADLILVALIFAGWPGSALWALGLFAGVNLITSGVAIIAAATSVRRVVTD